MPFGDIQDKNAQRAENTSVPALQAGAIVQNQTLEGMGLQTVTGATKTAQALGALAQDVIGNASAIVQKEAFVEAYANAGAGRSIKEIRAEQPAWTTLFGPSATVQGAQARALQTATANFGNEGLAMVDANKDKDPAAFHKMLAATVGSHLTGDSVTDTLITQKSTELVTEIAASHYKVHSKYVQELNVQTSVDTIGASLKTLNTMKGMTDGQSPEGIAIADRALDAALANTFGMDKLAHAHMLSGLIIQGLADGDATLLNKLSPSLSMTTPDATAVQHGYKQMLATQDAKKKADALELKRGLQETSDEYAARVKLSKGSAPPAAPEVEFTAVQRLQHEEARDKFWEEKQVQHRAYLAVGEVNLKRMAETGVSTAVLLRGIQDLEKTVGPLSLATYKEIIGTKIKKDEKGAALTDHMNKFYSGLQDNEGRDAHYELLVKKFGEKGVYMVLDDVARRNEPSGVQSLRYEFGSNLSRPRDGAGANPNFRTSFAKFSYLYGKNPSAALNNIEDTGLRAEYLQGMEAIRTGAAQPEDIIKKFSSVKSVTARELSNPTSETGIAITKAVKKYTAGKGIMPWTWGNTKAVNSRYVEDWITNRAVFASKDNNSDPDAIVASAAMDFPKTHEMLGNHWENNGGKPFVSEMKLADPRVSINTVLEHYKTKLKMPDVVTTIDHWFMEIQQATKKGIPTGPKIRVPLAEMGRVYNSEVLVPAATASAAMRGASTDDAKESTIQLLMRGGIPGGPVIASREHAVNDFNRVTTQKAENWDAIKTHLSKQFKGMGELPGALHAIGVDALTGIKSMLKSIKSIPKGGLTTYD